MCTIPVASRLPLIGSNAKVDNYDWYVVLYLNVTTNIVTNYDTNIFVLGAEF